MDKNQTIGLFLIGLLLIAYYFYMLPKYEKARREQMRIQDSLAHVAKDTNAVNQVDTAQIARTSAQDSIAHVQMLQQKYGGFGNQVEGSQHFIVLKNDKVKLTFTNKGARVYKAQVLGYKTYNGDPLILFYGDKNKFNLVFSVNRRPINTQDFYFKPIVKDTLLDATKKSQKLVYRLYYSKDKWLDFIYTLKPGSYLVDFDIYFHNLKDIIPPSTTFLDLYWKDHLPPLERGNKWEYQNTDIYYKYYQADVEHIPGRKDYVKKEVPIKLRWISFKHQFFASVLLAYDKFDEAVLQMSKSKDPRFLKVMEANIEVPFVPLEQDTIKLAFYFGPNKYSILKKIKLKPGDKLHLERMIPLGKGLIRWINEFLIIPLFNILGRYIHNYGILILVMTLIIKLLLSPFTFKTYMSSAKMKALKPEIDAALAKIPKDDQMKRQRVMMDLYKRAGVSPMSGCIPVLLQFPILVAMFRFFPASIELRQQSFLWVKDLSSYDAIISWGHKILGFDHISLFAVLMAIAIYITSALNQAPTDDSNPTAKSMKLMIYLMPLLFFVWFNNYSAALSYYYFLSNLFAILQIYLIKKFIDEDKLRMQLKENIKKNKGKKTMPSWQQRLLEESRKRAEMQKKRRR